MLNGFDPLMIFQFSRLLPGEIRQLKAEGIPIDVNANQLQFPPIPVYLSESLTGLYIDSEDKNIDIETTTETLVTGENPKFYQRGISSVITINMLANNGSIGLTVLAALADLVFPHVTAREYSVSYFHGPITVFGGLLHSFAVTQNSNDSLYRIKLELIKPPKEKPVTVPVVARLPGAVKP